MGALNRRSLFGVAPALAVAAMPVAVAAQPDDGGWAAFRDVVQRLNPGLAEKADQAKARGFKVEECLIISAPTNGAEPMLIFQQQIGVDQSENTAFGLAS